MFEFPYPTIFRGQQTWDGFTLDYRNTRSPFISEKGYIDFFLSGELIYNKEGCGAIKNSEMSFFANNDTLSQFVISE